MTAGPPLPSSDFGDLLRRRRTDLGLTQQALAERAGLSVRAISDLERGVKRGPHRDTIARLADALGLDGEARAAFAAARRRPPRAVAGPSAPARPLSPLPTPLTQIVGREREAASVRDLLRRADVRLVTLVGAGGVGKTRLALHVAANLEQEFADGVAFVALAPISHHEQVSASIAQAVGVRELGSRPLIEAVADRLREQELLLLIDNFEHVLEAAPIVAALLTACPRLTALVTSRAGLHIDGEWCFPVPPLALPDLTRQTSLTEVEDCEAVRLFEARAQAVQPDFAAVGATALTVAEVCRRLDALPLAIELAAARVGLLPPAAMLARLERRLPLLTGGTRDAPRRLHTMRGAIAWSYDLLAPAEQALFRRLAVFAGGFTVEAAEAVAGGGGGEGMPLAPLSAATPPERGDSHSVLDLLAVLLDHSLLRRLNAADGDLRFGMLETVREYGLEVLAATGEESLARRSHATYFLALAETAERELRGAEQPYWLARLETEHDNLRAALAWCLEQGEPVLGLRLAGALWRFWYVRGHFGEGRRWLERALTAPGPAGSDREAVAARARALHGAGVLAHAQADYARATPLLEEGLALFRALGDRQGTARSLHTLGNVAACRGDYARAEALYGQSLELARELGDDAGASDAIENLGIAARDRGDLARAAALIGESLALERKLGNEQGIADALENLGITARDQGDLERAAALLEASLARYRALGDAQGIADTLDSLGSVAVARGDHASAASLFAESLAWCRTLGDGLGLAYCLDGFAIVAEARGRPDRAARLAGAAAALREATGARLPPAEAARHARHLATVRDRLGAAPFTAAWAAGTALPLEQAIMEALAMVEAVAAGGKDLGLSANSPGRRLVATGAGEARTGEG